MKRRRLSLGTRRLKPKTEPEQNNQTPLGDHGEQPGVGQAPPSSPVWKMPHPCDLASPNDDPAMKVNESDFISPIRTDAPSTPPIPPSTSPPVPSTKPSPLAPNDDVIDLTEARTPGLSGEGSCFICGKPLTSDWSAKARHIKQCAKLYGVGVPDLKPAKPHFPGARRTITEFFNSGPKMLERSASLPTTPAKVVPAPTLTKPVWQWNNRAANPSPEPKASIKRSSSTPNATTTTKGRSSFAKQNRKVPWYKRIPSTPFAVDAFRYATDPDVKVFFLTHFHADHYAGLTSSFEAGPIYCSPVTARLVLHRYRISPTLIHPIAFNTPTMVHGVEVVFMDANHCPGSAIIRFRFPTCGTIHLHTGDFRACEEMKSYEYLTNIRVHSLFLDTTYCKPQYTFEPQQRAINRIVETVRCEMSPQTLVVIGTYQIGKERVFLSVAAQLKVKVCVTKAKLALLRLLDLPDLDQHVTTNPLESTVHVISMFGMTHASLSSVLNGYRPRFSRLVAIRPTGWSHDQKRSKATSGDVCIYSVPYSEHSSFDELCMFVRFTQPVKIIPTVNNRDRAAVDEMVEALTTRRAKQTELA